MNKKEIKTSPIEKEWPNGQGLCIVGIHISSHKKQEIQIIKLENNITNWIRKRQIKEYKKPKEYNYRKEYKKIKDSRDKRIKQIKG